MLTDEIKAYIKEIVKETIKETLNERLGVSSPSEENKQTKPKPKKPETFTKIRKDILNYSPRDLVSRVFDYFEQPYLVEMIDNVTPSLLSMIKGKLEEEINKLRKEYLDIKEKVEKADVVILVPPPYNWVEVPYDILFQDDLSKITQIFSAVLANRATINCFTYTLEEHNKLNG